MKTPRIVVMAGSSRREALSRGVAAACVQALKAAGAEVEHIELADYPAPMYNGDLEAEAGVPECIVRLQQRWESCSLLEVELKTGRTHEIRVHLQSQGFPLLGDDKYGDFDLNKKLSIELLSSHC